MSYDLVAIPDSCSRTMVKNHYKLLRKRSNKNQVFRLTINVDMAFTLPLLSSVGYISMLSFQ